MRGCSIHTGQFHLFGHSFSLIKFILPEFLLGGRYALFYTARQMESAGVTRSYMEIVPFMNMEIISQRRTELMGFATIWIAVLHGPLWFHTTLLSLYKASGYCGVEMFLFLSAFGLYYSYHSHKTTAVEFFRRRLMRLLPAVIAVSLFSMIVMNNKIWNMLSCYWFLGFFWRKDITAWFLPAIIVLYAISPLYLKYFDDGREEKMTAAAMAAGLLLGLLLRQSYRIVFYFRIPVFFLGFLAGKYSFEKRPISAKMAAGGFLVMLAAMAVLSFALYQNRYISIRFGWILYWFPASFFTWPLCLTLALLFDWLDRHGIHMFTALNKNFGTISLEFYLLFELVILKLRPVFTTVKIPDPQGFWFGLAAGILTYLLCKIISWTEKRTAGKWILRSAK
jgi:peptidoglycan/LPS O-acetylase OafA/YrhL